MNEDQKKKCHYIIHSHAIAAGAGNAIPVPGLGVATDLVTITAMTMSLVAVFGGSITEEAAKAVAIASFKNAMLKQPIKVITKEVSKFIPFLGQAVAPTISVVIIEAVGWNIADELYSKSSKKYPIEKPVDVLEHDTNVKEPGRFSIANMTSLINAATDFRKAGTTAPVEKTSPKEKAGKAVKIEPVNTSGKTV